MRHFFSKLSRKQVRNIWELYFLFVLVHVSLLLVSSFSHLLCGLRYTTINASRKHLIFTSISMSTHTHADMHWTFIKLKRTKFVTCMSQALKVKSNEEGKHNICLMPENSNNFYWAPNDRFLVCVLFYFFTSVQYCIQIVVKLLSEENRRELESH